MNKPGKNKKVWIAVAALCLPVLAFVGYYFQHKSVDVGGYTVVYFKNQCDIDAQALPSDLESLKALPCLIRINWRERVSSDMEQEYSYIPGRDVEKTRLIHKKQ
jgi:hypothetical protein